MTEFIAALLLGCGLGVGVGFLAHWVLRLKSERDGYLKMLAKLAELYEAEETGDDQDEH